MKARESRIENSGWNARSFLECRGKRSTTPLSDATDLGEKRRRRCALPAQSKVARVLVAVLLSTLNFQLSTAFAQTYSIDWYKVSGGGGTSTGGVYSVSGTIGQADAGGPMAGGNFSLTGGFWALYALQSLGAPVLSIKLTTTNTAMVYWPSPSTGWTLQENTNSISSGNWTDHPFPQDNGTIKYTIVNPPSGKRFYRLKNP